MNNEEEFSFIWKLGFEIWDFFIIPIPGGEV